jgi:hypothetical protein
MMVGETEVFIASRKHEGAKAVVYFGGNGDDVSKTLPELAKTYSNHALYLLHYRGYGGSPGLTTEAALTADALALFDRVYAKHQEVVVIGRSLGTGMAVQLASVRPAARLVLITPYASLADLAAQRYPYVPVNLLLIDKYDSQRFAPKISAPTLVVVAENDEIIPALSSEQLLSRFQPGVARMQVIPGVGHNSILESPLLHALLAKGQ